MRNVMKSLVMIAVLALGTATVSADCGVKDTHEGTLKAANAENNAIIVVVGEEEVKLTLTEKSKVTDGEGNVVEASKLVGKKVKVVSEHAKIDSIEQIA